MSWSALCDSKLKNGISSLSAAETIRQLDKIGLVDIIAKYEKDCFLTG